MTLKRRLVHCWPSMGKKSKNITFFHKSQDVKMKTFKHLSTSIFSHLLVGPRLTLLDIIEGSSIISIPFWVMHWIATLIIMAWHIGYLVKEWLVLLDSSIWGTPCCIPAPFWAKVVPSCVVVKPWIIIALLLASEWWQVRLRPWALWLMMLVLVVEI